ncbi:hypothetical protein PI172_2109 [Prevotella intermedia]|uniref:Uncharacterized protein n=1 Tax=Prevotella intermedia TaxID=28131 RepID=A0AAD1BHX8_PREIN|nr:hypothetical protein PIN17_0025 [Prevotella intermedia 17]BAR96837.1 hypothetical protein PI172_2109 [Prevotella intermedia]
MQCRHAHTVCSERSTNKHNFAFSVRQTKQQEYKGIVYHVPNTNEADLFQ